MILSHPITSGRHNKTVYEHLETEGYDVSKFQEALISEAINQGMSQAEANRDFLEVRNTAAFDRGKDQAFKRLDISMSELTFTLRNIPKQNPGILRKPKKYASVLNQELHKIGAKLSYDPISGMLGVSFDEQVVPGLKRILGLSDERFKLCEIYIKEIALNATENEPSGRRLQDTADTRRSFDDPGGFARGGEIWRRWRQSVPDLSRPDGAFVNEHRQTASRNDVDHQTEYASDLEAYAATAVTARSLQEAGTVDVPGYELQDFNLGNVFWLTQRAAAKLKQKSRDVPPEFSKPLVASESPLMQPDFDPKDYVTTG